MSSGMANFASITAIPAADAGILLNGAECSAPAAIDGTVYIIHGNGAK